LREVALKRAVTKCGIVAALCTIVAHARAPSGHYETFGPTDDTILDAKTRLTWQRVVGSERFSWAAAAQTCAARTLAGRPARLPSVKELLTLVDEDVNLVYVGTDVLDSRAIDKFAFPATPGTYFWSSTKQGSDALVVDFRYGNTQRLAPDLEVAVRCVAD
jgi:hypothetical protein